MSKLTAQNIIMKMSFSNDFERINYIKLVLKQVTGANVSDLHFFFHLHKSLKND